MPIRPLQTSSGDADPEAFWAQVDANFQAGRVKLVFVADNIPRELVRVIEFLNEQMKADVRAVELKWYQNSTGATTLVPRVFGETERAATQKGTARAKLGFLNVVQWIDNNIRPRGTNAVLGAEAFMAIIEELGGLIEVARTQGSIFGSFRSKNGNTFCPLHLTSDNRITLSFNYLLRRPALIEEAARKIVYDRVVEAVGTLSTTNLQGYPSFLVTALSTQESRDRFAEAVSQLIEMASVD